MATSSRCPTGQSTSALPSSSDVDLLGDRESIIDLYALIPDGALDLCVAEQQDGSQVTRSPISASLWFGAANGFRSATGPSQCWRSIVIPNVRIGAW